MNIGMSKFPVMEWVVVFCLLGDVFIPPLSLPGYGVEISAAAAPFVFVACIAKLRHGYLKMWAGIWLVASMGMIVFVSSFWSYVALGVPPNGADFVEAYKYLQFIPYLLAIQFVSFDKFDDVLFRCVSIAAPIILVVGFVQLLAPNGMGTALSNLYGAGVQSANLQNGGRLLLTGTDPNVGAAVGVFFMFYFSMRFYDRKRVLPLAFCLMFLVLVLQTQSRTALGGVFIASVFYAFFFSKARLIARVSMLAMVIIIGYYLLTHLNLKYVSLGFQEARSGNNNSLNVRVENLDQAWLWFNASPWVGWGPAKSIHSTIIDSEYALILERYGIAGIVIFLSYIFMHIAVSYKVIKAKLKKSIAVRCALLYMIFGVVLMATNNLFSGYQLMALVILLLCSSHLASRQAKLPDRLSDGLSSVRLP